MVVFMIRAEVWFEELEIITSSKFEKLCCLQNPGQQGARKLMVARQRDETRESE
jgi:hypothetical protein